jgi:multicomponent Na+:H+ antiporter subunit E
MNGFLWNCLLAIVWVFVTGEANVYGAAVGFIIGTGILVVIGPAIWAPNYLRKVFCFTRLVVLFFRDLVRANLEVSFDVLTRQSRLRPGIIAVPLDVKTDAEITALASLLTLTPGTTALDVSPDRSTMYVHFMYLDEDGPEAARRKIKEGLERHLLEVTR